MWITLTGFMGSGKTTVGRFLGPEMNRPLFSLDTLAEARTGCSIVEYFSRHGEEAFRELELQMIRGLDAESDLVLDAGGGLVENPRAVSLVRDRGLVIWLDPPWDAVRGRLHGAAEGTRPLVDSLGWAGLEALYHRRLPLYARAADFRLQGTDDSPDELARLASLRCRLWGNLNSDPAP
jgi:shikimate kinase